MREKKKKKSLSTRKILPAKQTGEEQQRLSRSHADPAEIARITSIHRAKSDENWMRERGKGGGGGEETWGEEREDRRERGERRKGLEVVSSFSHLPELWRFLRVFAARVGWVLKRREIVWAEKGGRRTEREKEDNKKGFYNFFFWVLISYIILIN